MAINSYVGQEIVSSTDTFNLWLTRTNSIITDMGSVVVSVGDNNVGDVTITGALGANTLFAGSELRGGDANTPGALSITSDASFDSGVTISGAVLLNGASANVDINTSALNINSTNTFFNDRVEFEDDMIVPVGTTAQRGEIATGNFRFNTTLQRFEGYTGSEWNLTADSADTLTTARNISLTGDVTGNTNFDGSGNVSITTTLVNNSGTAEIIQDIVGAMFSGNEETGITVTYQDSDGTVDFVVDSSQIDHDSLLNFVANEHVDHSSVSILSGNGLSGGGDLTSSRTLSIDAGDGLIANSSGIHIDPTANVTINNLITNVITANGSVGNTGQVLSTDGNTIFWQTISVDNDTVKDVVGEMFSGNSESGISVVYQSSDKTVDFDVDDFTITLGGDLSGSTTITNLGNATLTATVTGGAADTLANPRTITLAGEVTGNTTFDGSSNVTITTNLETVNGFTSTGNIILSNADLDGFVTATYSSQFSITGTSGAITINWNEGQNQIQTEPTGAIAYTFTDPAGPGHFQLIIASDGTSTAQAITWPGSVKWMGTPYAGVDNKAAIVNFYYDGSSTYYAIASYEN